MDELLENFKKNYFLDETNVGITKEHYKEEGFKQTIFFKIERNELGEEYFDECLKIIKPLLNNEKLVICNTSAVRYETNSYSVDDINSIETINEHLNKNKVVLLYSPIMVDGVLKYKTRLL